MDRRPGPANADQIGIAGGRPKTATALPTVGVVVGGAILIAAAAAGILFWNHRRKVTSARTAQPASTGNFGVRSAQSSATAAALKNWTILVFMNGNNSQDLFAGESLADLVRGARTDTNILVQWATSTRKTVTRNLITPAGMEQLATLPYTDTDMGDVASLIDFLRWGVEAYPANHYLVSIWSADYWKPMGTDYQMRSVSFDANTQNSISTKQIGDALREVRILIGRNVDVYATDAPLLGLIEVECELRGFVDYYITSEGKEAGQGSLYAGWFRKWGETPQEVAIELARAYTDVRPAMTMTVVKMDQLSKVTTALAGLAKLMRKYPQEAKSAVARSYSPNPKAQLVDIGSYVRHFRPSSAESRAVLAALAAYVVFHKPKDKAGMDPTCTGVSVWLPTAPDRAVLPFYAESYFDTLTDWTGMLKILWQN